MNAPTTNDLRRAADALGIDVSGVDLEVLRPFVDAFLATIVALEPAAAPGARSRRDQGHEPTPADNPFGAWRWRCSIRESDVGPLAGRTVALKDNIALAGIPMMNGTAALRDHVADIDATVVRRILAAGGEIVGKAVCENLCVSAGSHTAATGPVRNPHDPSRTSGGSSSGCGVVVATGDADLAVGGDQGGSIRIPASHCGIVGLKPTYGLVPYTGAVSIDPSIDHLGPMGRSVEDVARLLDVLAGSDGIDPRQRDVDVRPYLRALTGDIASLRIGVLDEGFGHATSDPRVDALVRDAVHNLSALGTTVAHASVPAHRTAGGIAISILCHGLALAGVHGCGIGTLGRAAYDESLVAAWGPALPTAELPATAIVFALTGQVLLHQHHARYYARAQNLAPSVTAAYDRVFADVDVLAMPTTGMLPPPLPPTDADLVTTLTAAFASGGNTAVFDVTGHPAISLPCGDVDGLPVGLMLVGRRFEDDVVLRVAHAFEQLRAARG